MGGARVGTLVLLVAGAAMLLVGWAGLRDPVGLLAPVGVQLAADGLNEARAAYGGMHVGLGLLMLSGAVWPARRRMALWTVVAVMGGLVAGRALSVAVDGPPGGFVTRLGAIELAGSLGAIAALALAPREA